MRNVLGSKNSKLFAMLMALTLVVGMTGCRVRQTEEGKMPDVDVKVEDGKLPEYDVDTADVDVKTKTTEVEVPDVDVDVNTKKEEIKVPDVDVTMPSEKKPPQE